MIANYVGDVLFTKGDADVNTLIKQMTEGLTVKESNVVTGFVRDFIAWVKSKVEKLGLTWDDVHLQRLFAESFVAATSTVGAKENTTDGGVQYQLNENAKTEVHKALYDKNYRNEIKLRDVTPPILLSQSGVRNLPMAMIPSHIRENVFTEEEAKKLGLPINDRTHYHGLGEDFFLKIIDNLDNVTEAYRGTKYAEKSERREKYFLLITEFKDDAGNVINVPVFINQHANYNRTMIDVNKIATNFGRDNLRSYLQKEVRKKNLVRIKNRSLQTGERSALIAPGYGMDASEDSIPQNSDLSRGILENSENTDEQRSIPQVEGQYSIPDEAKANADKAAKHFGTTSRINEAGYILVDGRMLDMSGKHDGAPGGYRTVDHRDIKEALGLDYGGEDYSGAMVQFMSEGNIRIAPESGGINVSVMPNQFQRGALTRFINKFSGEVVLDIDDLRGNTVASVEYPYGTSASVVLNDVSDYFEKGKLPESFDAQYSIPLTKDTDGKKLSPEQAKYFKDSKVRKKIPNEDRSGSCFLVLSVVPSLAYFYINSKRDFKIHYAFHFFF